MTLAEEKKALRAAAREALKSMSEESRREQSAAACEAVLSLPAFQSAKTLLLYRAMPSECDPAEIARAAARMDKRVAYPLCGEGRSLRLYVPRDESAFVRGSYGILEPDAARSDEIGPGEPDLIVVPGLAFDRTGGRLGRGAGYYDRLLREARAVKLGFGFHEQLAKSVPMEPFDVKMDCVVLAKWIYCE